MMNIIKLKILLILFYCGISCSTTSQIEYIERYEIENYKSWKVGDTLTWDDYQGDIPSDFNINTHHKAKSSIRYRVHDPLWDEHYIYVYAIPYLSLTKSWVAPDYKDYLLLKHEQLHFDIAELYMRKLRKKLSEYVSKETILDEVYDIIQSSYDEMIEKVKSTQEQYDLETNHGLVLTKQKEWEDRITEELEEYSEWADPNVKIKRVLPEKYLEDE